MTYLVERLAELKRYLAHARTLRPRVPDTAALERDLPSATTSCSRC